MSEHAHIECTVFNMHLSNNQEVVCITPPTGFNDAQLSVLIEHQSFLDRMSEEGFLPFPHDADLDDTITALQRRFPDGITELLLAQDAAPELVDGNMPISILHTVREDRSVKINCDTRLSLPLNRKNAVVLRLVR